MQGIVPTTASGSFYSAAAAGLRFLDRRATGRRVFGQEADARWQGFAGHLRTADRLDLALRDGAVSWGAAFSAASVFQLVGLAPDEPFGPDWPGLPEDDARRVWREAAELEVSRWDQGLARIQSSWSMAAAAVPSVPAIGPATKLLVAGCAAIEAAARAFAESDTLSWADQVVVVGSSPAERHLAGLVAVLIDARGPTRLVSPEQASPAGLSPAALVQEAGLSGVDQLLISNDAPEAVRAFANAAADSRRG